MEPLPQQTGWVVVGAGFAGAATAWALGRAGLGPGIIVEQEASWGVHASGRNAGMMRLCEYDPIIACLARRSVTRIRELEQAAGPLVKRVGGLTVAGPHGAAELGAAHESMRKHGLDVELLSRSQAQERFPFFLPVEFDTGVWCPDEGVVDIHALLGFYVARAGETGFSLHTKCRVEDLIVEAGRVTGVHTNRGDVRAERVVDASGAWAGRLGRASATQWLRPLQRHIFVSAPTARVPPDAPLLWVEDAGFYFRPESGGLLFSPCDETPAVPGLPATDPAAAELLADKISRCVPDWVDLGISRSWACLRTFAPDRRPVIGADPRMSGLFHVSGLGGVGMMCSAAIGELAADLLTGRSPDWIDANAVTTARLDD